MSSFLIFLIVIGVVVFWAIAIYNGFIKLRTQTDEAWADIDVQLKRRYDLIPNLIETVKGYASHEKETFNQVTAARTQATQINIDPTKVTAEQMKDFSAKQGELSQALGRLIAISENYPDLKASQNFSELQKELSDTENKIQAARRFYNTNVRDLNIKVESIPSNIIANLAKITKREFFELEEGSVERENVQVKF
jgi:LemA protein